MQYSAKGAESLTLGNSNFRIGTRLSRFAARTTRQRIYGNLIGVGFRNTRIALVANCTPRSK